MTVETPSWMASITKTMSATLMMMLVDQGLVDLDAPIGPYLPALRGIKAATQHRPGLRQFHLVHLDHRHLGGDDNEVPRGGY